MMETVEEFEAARRRLEQRSPKALADFILSLAHAPHGIGEYVEVFVASDDPARAGALIEGRLAALRRGEREYDWRHRRGSDFAARVGLVLDAIEHVVLPVDPLRALRLLEQFYDSEGEIVDGSFDDDFGVSLLLERAGTLFQAAAGRLSAAEAEVIRERLLARDEYGLRARAFNQSR